MVYVIFKKIDFLTNCYFHRNSIFQYYFNQKKLMSYLFRRAFIKVFECKHSIKSTILRPFIQTIVSKRFYSIKNLKNDNKYSIPNIKDDNKYSIHSIPNIKNDNKYSIKNTDVIIKPLTTFSVSRALSHPCINSFLCANVNGFCATILYDMKLYSNSISLFKSALGNAVGDAYISYNIACNYSLLNKKSEALFWLNKSLEYGWSDWQHAIADKDFSSLREDPEFIEIIRKMKLSKSETFDIDGYIEKHKL